MLQSEEQMMIHTLAPADHDLADFEAYIAAQTDHMLEPDSSDCQSYLRSHPSDSMRAWKGKSDSRCLPGATPDEKPWQSLKPVMVREMATNNLARHLPHNVRQAAAHDPELVWNPLARKYRQRQPGDPRPA
jgi:hypothetical protein